MIYVELNEIMARRFNLPCKYCFTGDLIRPNLSLKLIMSAEKIFSIKAGLTCYLKNRSSIENYQYSSADEVVLRLQYELLYINPKS